MNTQSKNKSSDCGKNLSSQDSAKSTASSKLSFRSKAASGGGKIKRDKSAVKTKATSNEAKGKQKNGKSNQQTKNSNTNLLKLQQPSLVKQANKSLSPSNLEKEQLPVDDTTARGATSRQSSELSSQRCHLLAASQPNFLAGDSSLVKTELKQQYADFQPSPRGFHSTEQQQRQRHSIATSNGSISGYDGGGGGGSRPWTPTFPSASLELYSELQKQHQQRMSNLENGKMNFILIILELSFTLSHGYFGNFLYFVKSK